MSEEALQACIRRHLTHAAEVFILDDELGTHHGLSWADFMLLTVLDAAGGAAPHWNLPVPCACEHRTWCCGYCRWRKPGWWSAWPMARATAM